MSASIGQALTLGSMGLCCAVVVTSHNESLTYPDETEVGSDEAAAL